MHLFFDIDDTLLQSSSAEQGAARAFALTYPAYLGNDPDAFTQAWHAVSASYYAEWVNGRLSFYDQRRARIRHYWGASLSDAAANALFSEYLAFYRQHWCGYDDVQPCLAKLADYRLAVITNGEPAQQRAKLDALDISTVFTEVITPHEAGACKPHRAIFTYAAALVGAAPAECVYIGDQLDDDARAATRAGWRGIWLDRSVEGSSVEDVPVIHTLHELPQLLEQMTRRQEMSNYYETAH